MTMTSRRWWTRPSAKDWSTTISNCCVIGSPLHGHDYSKGMKVDAISGQIYDVLTRQRCGSMKEKRLNEMQRQLRQSKDFSDRATALFPPLP
jgi:hypothetical protein